MKKIYIYQDPSGNVPFIKFLNHLDKKLCAKLLDIITNMRIYPKYMKPPYVKHFSTEKYSKLFEIRVRIKTMARVVFTIDKQGDIIILDAFDKKRDRSTMQALEKSLKLLDDIDENIGELVLYTGGDADKL